MFLISLNAEIVVCILSFRKSRHKPNLENTSQYGFSPDLGEKIDGVLSMRMQVILNSSFVRQGSTPIWGGKKVEFRDWTNLYMAPSTCIRIFLICRAATFSFQIRLPSTRIRIFLNPLSNVQEK